MKSIIFILAMLTHKIDAIDYHYENIKKDNHHIHIVTLNLKEYDCHLVKAHDQVFGRESIESIALRSNAQIAINGGFFEIGLHHDGKPSGTLIIDGKILGLKSKKHHCLIKKNNQLSIKSCTNNIKMRFKDQQFPIHKVNQFAGTNDIILYTSLWGISTLTNHQNRNELILDKNKKFIDFQKHGNNKIPKNGFVISLPNTHPLCKQNINAPISIDFSQTLLKDNDSISALMGIPQLIDNNKIMPAISTKKTSFYTEPHARSAIGLKPNGDIVLIVAEHIYSKSLPDITLGDVQSLLKTHDEKINKQFKKPSSALNLIELKTFIIQTQNHGACPVDEEDPLFFKRI
jgi:hypothetical protein